MLFLLGLLDSIFTVKLGYIIQIKITHLGFTCFFCIFVWYMSINGRLSNSLKKKRFEKVASSRVRKIKGLIDLLGNCANRHNYDYSEKDVELMFRAINQA